MLWTLFLLLVVLWVFGVIGSIGGALIHILLAVAVVVALAGLVRRITV